MSQFENFSSYENTGYPSSKYCPYDVLGADVAKWSNAWLEIDASIFERNIERLKDHVGTHVEVCVTLKANGYNHGIDLLMPSVIKMDVPAVGVSSNAEALLVRRSGFNGRLLRLRTASLPEMIEGFQFGVEEILGSVEVATALSYAAKHHGTPIRIHLAINSGQMGRSDIDMTTEVGRIHAQAILMNKDLIPSGIMTHFALEEPSILKQQALEFQNDAEWLVRSTGLERDAIVFHAANSNALMEVSETHFDMIRPGRVLYGYSNHPQFNTLMTFKSRVTSINEYRANTGVTYNHTYVLQRDSRLANIPVGYSDSHRKEYTGGDVLIRGHRAPIVGAITMNSLMVDVTDFPDIEANDEVVLYGRQENDAIWGPEIQKYIQESMVEMTTRWSVNPKVLSSSRARS